MTINWSDIPGSVEELLLAWLLYISTAADVFLNLPIVPCIWWFGILEFPGCLIKWPTELFVLEVIRGISGFDFIFLRQARLSKFDRGTEHYFIIFALMFYRLQII